jgi:hypothetical protein
VSKLWANTLWGYLALNTNKSQFRIINNNSQWQQLLQNSRYQVKSVYSNAEDHLQVVYGENSELHEGNNKTNVILASFVTAHARIRLFRELKKLGDRAVYCDTGR